MKTETYIRLKKRRRDLGELLEAGIATAQQRQEHAEIVAQIKADPPTPEQLYVALGA